MSRQTSRVKASHISITSKEFFSNLQEHKWAISTFNTLILVANFQQKALFGQRKTPCLSSSFATLALKLWRLLVFVLLKKKKLPHHQCGFVNHWNTGLQEGHTKAEHECGVWNPEEDPPSPSPPAREGGNKRITHKTMVGILFHTVSVVSLWNADDMKYIYTYIY